MKDFFTPLNLDSIWLPSKVKGVGFSSEKDMKKALNKD
jgi:hypothetical protein